MRELYKKTKIGSLDNVIIDYKNIYNFSAVKNNLSAKLKVKYSIMAKQNKGKVVDNTICHEDRNPIIW